MSPSKRLLISMHERNAPGEPVEERRQCRNPVRRGPAIAIRSDPRAGALGDLRPPRGQPVEVKSWKTTASPSAVSWTSHSIAKPRAMAASAAAGVFSMIPFAVS